MGSEGHFEKRPTTYYLPPGYRAERTHDSLLLRRPDGTAVVTLYGERSIGEIAERYAWADQPRQKIYWAARAYEQLFQLPIPIVIMLLYLAGAVPVSLCAAALYCLWSP